MADIVKVETTESAVQNYGWTPPEMILAQREMVKQAAAEYLDEGPDFGTIKGCGDRKVLFKAGAEKLSFIFGLVPEIHTEVIPLENGHREYISTCTIYNRAGERIVTNSGSATTLEKKYRYRWDKNRQQVENPDIADTYNTVLKMAEKRALVAAVLVATNASAMFTQDLEDSIDNSKHEYDAVAPKKVRAADLKKIQAMFDELGTTQEQLKKILESFNVKSFKDLNEREAASLIKRLEQEQTKKAEKATDGDSEAEAVEADIEF